ncbi:hypothetical protein HCB21_10290 [Listeria booriae]|uniref:toxin Cry1Ac domain D-VI-related protein n=1 Tax=Listeria booriae TaxID=1552123 RepID=UPI0016271FF7|nr:toxin Cry1Ac domain D-VI-related protein [Listeria booriae]MBC2160160.1 hypothetical protein [Listeria booriae]
MTSKKTLAKKAVKTMAVAAVAFSVVAQPLSMIVSADEVTPKAERQLLGATSNTIPVKLATPTFTTQAGVAGFIGWTGVIGTYAAAPNFVNNFQKTTSSVPDANGYITLSGNSESKLTSYVDNTGFTIKKNDGYVTSNLEGLQQTISTIPGKKYNVKVDKTSRNTSNYPQTALIAKDTSTKATLGGMGEYSRNPSTLSYDFIATGTSTDIAFLGCQQMDFSNIAVSQYVDTIVDDITNASTTVTGTALANQAVKVEIGDKVYTGTTDGTGKFSIDIEPPAAGQSVTVTCNYDVIPVTVTDALTPAAKTAADALFIDNNPSKDIKDTTTQADIDAAQAAVNKAPESAAKADLQKEIENAQAKLDVKTQAAATTAATTSVDNLFINNDPTKDIKDTTKQADIDAAQAAVNKITDPATKADLQKDIDKAQTQLDAKTAEAAAEAAATTAADALFVNNDPSKDIKDTTKQADIDAAQAAVNKVTDPTVKADLQKDIDKAQTQLDAKTAEAAAEAAATTATDALFVNNDPSKDIKDTTKQADIDAAQAAVNKVTDPTVKADLQKDIDKAQTQLDAKTAEAAAEAAATTATDALFVNNDPSKDIKDTIKQADIDAAQAEVNKVTDPTVKADLQKDIDKAQTQLDAKTSEAEAEAAATTATDALFVNNDPSKDIKDTTKQADIDKAQAAVDKVTDPTTKADLQKDIDKAQKELDEKTATTTATTSVDNLFIDNDPTKDIKDTTKQADIDAAQAAVNKVTDPATKADLQKDIDKAQTQLDAKTTEAAAEKAATTSVDNLFINNDPTKDIKNTTKQADIDAAQAAVNKVTDPTVKADLQKDIDKAQTQLDAKTAEKAAEAAAKTATDALFVNNDPSKNIKDTTKQADIDAAQALVNKVTDPTVKAGLQNEINKAQSQLDAVVPVTATAAKYTIGDLYITGTFTGPVTGLSMDVNGKRYYGGDVYSSNGTYRFYAADKGLKAGDVVTMNFYDATKQIKQSITVTVVDPLKVTVADYKVGDKYINATYNNSDVTQVGLVVDGVKYWGGDVANGTVKYYALDKIKSATSVATMNFYDASGNLLASKAIKIEASYAGEIKTANFKIGENNITGTFTGDVKKIAVSINGKMYYGGTVSPDTGSYKFYALDKKIQATDAVVVYGYDPDGKLLSQKNVTITE